MRYNFFIIPTIILCFLTGCGDGKNTKQNIVNLQQRPAMDWRTEEWRFDTLSTTEQETLYITKYIQDLNCDNEYFYIDHESSFGSYPNGFYELDIYIQKDIDDKQIKEYVLSCYNAQTEETVHRQIQLPPLREYPKWQFILQGMDMLDGQEYVLFVQAYGPDYEVMAYLVLHMSLSGECLSVTDLYPAMQEENVHIQDHYSYTAAYADQQGYYYLLSDYGITGLGDGEILVIGSEGELIDRIGSNVPGRGARLAMKDVDGNAVFEIYDAQEQGMLLIGYSAIDGVKQYGQVQLDRSMPMTMSSEGYVYYGTEAGKLYRWDICTGTREFCMDYQGLGISGSAQAIYMALGNDGMPLIMDCSRSETVIYQLGTDRGSKQASIQLISLATNSEYVSRCAMEFSRNNEECMILIEKPERKIIYSQSDREELENYRTRTLAELAAGRGADIYYVSADDMKMLYEKGVLEDLSGVLQEESVDAVYPGVLACGMIDGKQIGLAPEGEAIVVMVDNELWPGDHWTWEDVIKLGKQNPERDFLIYTDNYRWSLLNYNLGEAPFLDLETGSSNFMDSLFIQLLEREKRERDIPGADWVDIVRKKKTIAFVYKVTSFPHFSQMMYDCGEQYHLVGFPTEDGGRNYWNCNYYIVVNKHSEHKEQIKEYLNMLFQYDNQKVCSFPVRDDLLEGNLHYDETNHRFLYNDGEYNYWVYEKSDGGSWEEEYMELLNSCVPNRGGTDKIADIIFEEAESYFIGDKDAQAAASMIQNRVQLYLNEQK